MIHMNKKLKIASISIALSAIALSAILSAIAVTPLNSTRTYPAHLSVSPAPTFGLYSTAFDGNEISSLNFSNLMPGNYSEDTYFLRQVGTSYNMLVSISWTFDALPDWITLDVHFDNSAWGAGVWQVWNTSLSVPITFRATVNSNWQYNGSPLAFNWNMQFQLGTYP